MISFKICLRFVMVVFPDHTHLLFLVPCQLIVGLVASATYMGDYGTSPYYFGDYNCSSVIFYVDGQSDPSQPLREVYHKSRKMHSHAHSESNDKQ